MTVPPVVLGLDGVLKRYAWGSRTAIPDLLGAAADGEPVAELWLGAHPQDPSPVPSLDDTLERLIAADPVAMLGAATAARFGERLPFLLKVLAPEKTLSIQVHPNLEQARAGFAAEDARGIPRDGAQRNYRDPNHKPELLCALTPFDALCGFRPVADTIRLFDAIAVPELADVRGLLAGEDGLRAVVSHLLMLDDPEPLVAAVADACRRVEESDEWAGVAGAVLFAESDFPGDIGVVLALLLNHVRLEPGEAVYLGAGNMHCYLRGMGVEVMANSDNVLRCGLTPKHVDVPELLKITDFRPLVEPRCPATEVGGGLSFDPPIPDFRLSMVEVASIAPMASIADEGPQIVLCAEGAVVVGRGESAVALSPGRGAFLPARAGGFDLRGAGRVFLATVGS